MDNVQHPRVTATSATLQRRDCARAGAMIFAAGLLVSLLVNSLLVTLVSARQGISPMESLTILAAATFVVLLPAGLLGAVLGSELYRIAVDPSRWRPSPWWAWLIGFCIVQLLVLVIFLQEHIRKRAFVENERVSWFVACVYTALMILVAALFTIDGKPLRDAVEMSIVTTIISMFISDTVLINLVAIWRNEGWLAAPVTTRLQYSLATMLFLSLACGTWLTGLFLIFS